MTLFDLQVPFFLPVWRRVIVVVISFGWAFFEFVTGAALWGVIFGALGGFAVWQFFLTKWPEE
jgi:hypothetical protein